MTARKRLLLLACLAWFSLPAMASSDGREAWLMNTLRQSNPVREQLAMLGRPGQPVSIRVYRGNTLTRSNGQPVVARMSGNELALSEGLVDRLLALENGNAPQSARWTLLYVLAYLAARQLGDEHSRAPAGLQAEAQAMLQAFNQVLATAWEDVGRPQHARQRHQLLQQVLAAVPYAHDLLPAMHDGRIPPLRVDQDGFVIDPGNVRSLAWALASNGGHRDL